MQVLNTAVTNPAASTPPAGAAGGKSSAPANGPDQLTKESTFLQLLVAQIKNQDPLNPTDSMQFIGQLVSFSQLEQLLGINQGIQTLVGGGKPPAASTPPLPTRGGTQTN
jgi:flagellar basal-body rod modification protein FlgD